jgi:superfamily II DNA or RNA helicase
MKTLYPQQRKSVDLLKQALTQYGSALDSSMTGVGKTVIAARTALELGCPVAILCPKIVIPQWERELAEVGLTPLFVTNYEKIKRGNGDHLTKVGKKLFRWQLPADALLIVDECHKCKSPWSQNAQMLIAAVQQGYKTLLLSATACQDPTEMRALGFALGLHALNKPVGNTRSWFGWMMHLGCKQDPWKNWKPGPRARLTEINKELYGSRAVKLTPADLPGAFTESRVITEPLAFGALSDIAKFYEYHGVTAEIIEGAMDGTNPPEPHVLTQILRARQLAEAAKVPDLVEMITDAVAEGYSAAVFVNFTNTVTALKGILGSNASMVYGGQSAAERERDVQLFQSNENRVIVCNIAAGGVGVSLHDVHGGHPRMSFISPTFNVKEYVQALGRVHRAGAQTACVQRVLVAAKTIEEKIVAKLEEKRQDMDTLHAQPTPNPESRILNPES